MKPGTPPTSSGGAAPLAGDERRIVDVGFPISNVLDEDVVAPVVVEVIDVEEPLDTSADEGSPADPRRVVELAPDELVVRNELAVETIADDELEQVRIGPANGDLDDVVQGQQGGPARAGTGALSRARSVRARSLMPGVAADEAEALA